MTFTPKPTGAPHNPPSRRAVYEQRTYGSVGAGAGNRPGYPSAGQPRRGAPAGHPPSLADGLVDEALGRAGGRRRVRQALQMPSDRRILLLGGLIGAGFTLIIVLAVIVTMLLEHR